MAYTPSSQLKFCTKPYTRSGNINFTDCVEDVTANINSTVVAVAATSNIVSVFAPPQHTANIASVLVSPLATSAIESVAIAPEYTANIDSVAELPVAWSAIACGSIDLYVACIDSIAGTIPVTSSIAVNLEYVRLAPKTKLILVANDTVFRTANSRSMATEIRDISTSSQILGIDKNIRYTYGKSVQPGVMLTATGQTPPPPVDYRTNTVCMMTLWQETFNLVIALQPYGLNCDGSSNNGSGEPYVPTIPDAGNITPGIGVFAVTTSDGTSLNCISLSLSLNGDNWTYSWSATLDPAQSALIQPPMAIVATINGENFYLILESKSLSVQFGKKSINVNGRGQSAYLSKPYVVSTSRTNDKDTTANQLAASFLPTGWNLNFEIEDWVIPANAFVHSGTVIEALSRIAEAGGGYLQPVPYDKKMRIVKRYPIATWHWAELTEVNILSSEFVSSESIDYTESEVYDSVWIAGGTYGGRLDRVLKTGSGAMRPAPTVTDDLATDIVMTRQLGLAKICDSGKKTFIKLTVPLYVGFVWPGVFVKYRFNDADHIGLVRDMAIGLSFGKQSQNITIEFYEHI